jgi:DNA-3-methyladenine glycosylase II
VSYVPPSAPIIAAARAHLAAADPALARLEAVTPPFEWRLRPGGFFGLARLIVAQQVSLSSAEAIWSRLEAGLGEVAAGPVLACGEAGLLQFGLSRPKARYLHALARSAPELERLRGMPDGEAIAALTALMGVGRWTAETYLMFCEGRLDVFPAADVALQEAIRWADRAGARPDERAASARAAVWSPYRSVAAHLLWRCYGAVKRGEIGALD